MGRRARGGGPPPRRGRCAFLSPPLWRRGRRGTPGGGPPRARRGPPPRTPWSRRVGTALLGPPREARRRGLSSGAGRCASWWWSWSVISFRWLLLLAGIPAAEVRQDPQGRVQRSAPALVGNLAEGAQRVRQIAPRAGGSRGGLRLLLPDGPVG